MASECCLKGLRWDGATLGKEDKFDDHDCYITGSDTKAAVLIIHDLFGWTFKNTRLLADHYAEEAGVTTYLPDFFEGETLDPAILAQPDRRDWEQLDLPAFLTRNAKSRRSAEIHNFAKALKKRYQSVGVVGFCYGGWAAAQLASTAHADCIAFAHPTMLEKIEIDNIKVPVQILAPEHDDMFTPELKQYALQVLPKANVPFDYQYFPGLEHAFAIRGNPSDQAEREGMQRAKDAVVFWLRQWLKETR